LQRIARRRIVFLTWRADVLAEYWLTGYLPETARREAASELDIRAVTGLLPDAEMRTRRWHTAHADLLGLDALDVGYCLSIANL
jgi:hypothetical protein